MKVVDVVVDVVEMVPMLIGSIIRLSAGTWNKSWKGSYYLFPRGDPKLSLPVWLVNSFTHAGSVHVRSVQLSLQK